MEIVNFEKRNKQANEKKISDFLSEKVSYQNETIIYSSLYRTESTFFLFLFVIKSDLRLWDQLEFQRSFL